MCAGGAHVAQTAYCEAKCELCKRFCRRQNSSFRQGIPKEWPERNQPLVVEVIRAVTLPFSHVLWTGNQGDAFCSAKGLVEPRRIELLTS